MDQPYEKNISGCGLIGFLNRDGRRVSGGEIIPAIALMHDRTNGLGGGFAGYGIYPEYKELYAFHLMYEHGSVAAQEQTEDFLKQRFRIEEQEEIPTQRTPGITNAPRLRRYFLQPKIAPSDLNGRSEQDWVIEQIMHINVQIKDAFVFSSGKNMGAFKAVGYAEDVARFFRLEEYEGHCWTAHGRFPTNSQAWWGGAHPFTLLDYSVVHNGEISSYGINRRYLEMFGYQCTLHTDTEVMVYLLDLLVRRHGLSIEVACDALASPFWSDIERAPENRRELLKALRMVYGSALVNGPFAILFAHSRGLVGFNDRIKLRPMIAAERGKTLYVASEESAIREIAPSLDRVWMPEAGEPVVGWLEDEVS